MQKIKGKKILKNGAVAGYVYYSKERKWKWRIISGPKRKRGGTNEKNMRKKSISKNSQK